MRQYLLPLLLPLLSIAAPVSGAALSRGRTIVIAPARVRQQIPLSSTSATIDRISSLRGGASSPELPFSFLFPLDGRELVARAACAFYMGQASTSWLAPHQTPDKYGLTTSTLNVACVRKLAAAYLGGAIMMYGMLVQKCTPETAVGSASVAWMVEQLKSRLYLEAEEIGRPVLGEYLVAATATLTAYGTLWDLRFASPVMKFSAVSMLLNGLAFFAAPASVCRLWGIPAGVTASPNNKSVYMQQLKEYNETVFLHRYMGVALAFSGIMQAVLAWKGDIYDAIGYSFACLFAVNCWSFLKTSDFKRLARISLSVQAKIDFKKRLSKLFYPLFHATVCGTLLLGRPAAR
ncbi:expressed unknown protein [Seminavis robusta]|uniref:Uncharacterized protein n=1 Tax=Seminavis robusta TaxID=568900 RepID=A0A9N8DKY9_9STRA|nr:expressed unknown protein [Seminavis robusta]|eukprot:Sro180_g078630.1 n/a (348) ;mRNA; f:8631-9674